MSKLSASLVVTGLALLVLCPAFPARADDGIWLWNQRPKAAIAASGASGATGAASATGATADPLKQKHSLEIPDAFADNLRLSTVRLNNGSGSGSFVSANGLVLTNQHLLASCIAKLSNKEHDYTTDGFYAPAQSAELACPGLEASV